jgi:hypothetical protein
MKLYHASLSLEVVRWYINKFPETRLNVLRSFGLLDRDSYHFCCTNWRDTINGLILDSGTWTLNNTHDETLKKRLTVENYKNYLSKVGQYFDFYFNFDEDFSDKGYETNLANLKRLEKAGYQPVPVIHDIYGNEIDYYIKEGYRRVALGSSQIKSIKSLEDAMKNLVKAAIKVHLFGNTSFTFLTSFPIDSCDSTAWANKGSYGSINYWNPERKGLYKNDTIYLEEYLGTDTRKKYTLTTYPFKRDLEAYLDRELGITFHDLLGNDGAHIKRIVNLHYYVKLEKIINEIHRKKGFDTA